MARNRPSVVFLDTHVAVWLYAGLIEKISETAKQAIEEALKIRWTRDVFDRLLSAEANIVGGSFITADENIKSNLKLTIW
jgi:PIN domain nuclease of toxin-antitoxin system